MVPSWAAETIRARRLLPAAARPWRRFPRRSSRAHLWTWGGSDFGYRDGDELWTYDGRHVGRFRVSAGRRRAARRDTGMRCEDILAPWKRPTWRPS